MGYIVDFSQRAKEDFISYKKAGNKIALAKIDEIIEELKVHPETGIGKPKKLKNDPEKRWSRRIDQKNRMTYQINGNSITVFVVAAKGHYDDK